MSDLRVPPAPFDAARVQRSFASLAEKGFTPPDGAARHLLAGAFGNSGFLGRLALGETDILAAYFATGPEIIVEAAIRDAAGTSASADEAEVMTRLRLAKRKVALAVALADIAGSWPLGAVTGALSRFADAAVRGALRFVLRQTVLRSGLADSEAFRGKDGSALEACSGLTVLAMGKHGAGELNYSSDIDLVVFYDAAKFSFAKRGDPRGAAVDIVRQLVRLIAEITAEGYVFRVDLRLRPDASATQVAISTEAAEAYYESQGQNWERAAMIKARACAGDPETGAAFLKAIQPFIWRRNLDFAAIEDIHSIKRQIHAHAGHGEIAVAGHNIKLGRGGIREIEFFAQTQQLILGGRYPALRVPATLDALAALAAHGTISATAAQEMRESYIYLRTLEHRLQMVEDEQTHSVPRSQEGVAEIACFLGYADADAFRARLTGVLENVQGHYARLFEREAELTDAFGNLVFTGVEDDPETLETIKAMGFGDPTHVAGAIRGWHHGRIRAMRSGRARELLTKLTPAILKALAGAADPDSAFAQFNSFLSHLPSAVQLFSLFLARPEFLDLLARVVGAAPRLASHLAHEPATLDALLDRDFLRHLPDHAALAQNFLRRQSGGYQSGGYEETLDAARRFAREEIFRVGVRIVEDATTAADAGPALTAVAETVIVGLLPVVEAALAEKAGRLPGASFAVVAMGKLGGREMTASSDLDLVFIYDVPDGVEASDGAMPSSPPLYFARLAQRLIAALTVHTAAGGLYDVDMRLRPTGNKGPVAVSLKSFAEYHAHDSWTWEHMALTRARLVAGAPALAWRVEAAIRRRLTARADAGKVIADAGDMRAKVAAQYPGANMWDLKYAPGGLMDIEFIAQSLQLVHAHAHPGVLDANTIAALEKLAGAGLLEPGDAKMLLAAAALEQALTQTRRIALDESAAALAATPGLRLLLARAGDAPDFALLERRLRETQARTRGIFTRLIAGPGTA